MFKNTRVILLILLVYAMFSSVPAQQKQGNIVAYFGKEKVQKIHEGSLLHTFTNGLLLPTESLGFNSSSLPKDPVLSAFLTDEAIEIKSGTAMNEVPGHPAWQQIQADSTSTFRHRALRSGYLYIEYTSQHTEDAIFEASGHTMALINGYPHEGDHYDYGWSLIPIRLHKGKNTFLLKGGRFAQMRARLIRPLKTIAFTQRDKTLPDVLKEEGGILYGAIRVMNIQQKDFKAGSIICQLGDKSAATPLPNVAAMYVRKVPFQIPVPENIHGKKAIFSMTLKDRVGRVLDTCTIALNIKSKYDHHKQTFISQIDGSVQYYSIAPCTDTTLAHPALFFSVHGASVEAVNQAHAYKKKSWGHVVAPTNRRPFGFAWEDWGRLDALEVFDHAQKFLHTDPVHTYLTGHSMGGHGTWYLGATYPDRWAAIAPCAGYPDLLGYRDSFRRRLKNMSDEELKQFGMTRQRVEAMMATHSLSDPADIMLDSIVRRAGNPSRTLKLKRNYLHYGIYILHGEKDTVVPTFIAREMVQNLAGFHPDFAYYEYPGGQHWFGDQSVDWPPIFEFFKFRHLKADHNINKIEFYTASPGVSSSSHFVQIYQQEVPFGISSFDFNRDEAASIHTKNVHTLAIDLAKMGNAAASLQVDDQKISLPDNASKIYMSKRDQQWRIIQKPSAREKGPLRNGGFKDAFRHNMVLVYASHGSKTENAWWYHRALYDAEKFYYRANGNVELIKDTAFSPEKYPDQNVILYGNSTNNAAWQGLLKNCPLQVKKGLLSLGQKKLAGDNWGAYFIYPRSDSETASVGIVSATGQKGMKAAFANHYLVNGTTFPDVMIFGDKMIGEGLGALQCAGFFGNDWSVDTGDFVWR